LRRALAVEIKIGKGPQWEINRRSKAERARGHALSGPNERRIIIGRDRPLIGLRIGRAELTHQQVAHLLSRRSD
jgi:hypothetical protein